MSRVIAAHQPNFMPYLGFFDKMKSCDVFVIRDEVLFTDSDFHHRNRIRVNSNDNISNPGVRWLTVPVNKIRDNLRHVKIKKDSMVKKIPWNTKMVSDISANYKNTPYFDEFFPEIEKIFDNSDERLINLNMKIINLLKKAFNINTKIVFASELGLKPVHYYESDASEDLSLICQKLKGDIYLSGAGARVYLKSKPFEEKEIKIEFQEYKHPVYKQKFPGFIGFLASIDALLCAGEMPKATIEVQNEIRNNILK